jgi:hypothetical protein
MAGPKEPFDEEAAQKADQNRAHDIVSENAPPFARGDFPPANQDKPITPEEKRKLFARYFPTKEQDRGRERDDDRER